MYNRYVPQPDGTFLRNPVTDHVSRPAEPIAEQTSEVRSLPPPMHQPQEQSLSGLLRQLFPQGLDSEDLIVILLLLLMSDDPSGGKNNAILTLVIYLFL